MQKLNVTAQQLSSASTKVGDIAAQYQTAYKAIISAAEEISSQWAGDDFTAFLEKVHALEDDFKQMYDLLVGCSNDLRESAEGYVNTQSDNVSRARSLQTSL